MINKMNMKYKMSILSRSRLFDNIIKYRVKTRIRNKEWAGSLPLPINLQRESSKLIILQKYALRIRNSQNFHSNKR